MKKIFTLIIAALMAVSAWADNITIYSPTAEYNLRLSYNKDTGEYSWNTKKAASEQATFEINHASLFCAIQQYKITSLADATSITLALTNGSGSDALAIWAVPSSITWTSDMSASDFVSLYSTTTGMEPGVAGTASNTYLLQDATTVTTPSKFTFSGDHLTIIKNNAASDGTITLLITNKTLQMTTSSTKRTYLSSNSTNAKASRPVLTVTTPSSSDAVKNTSTGDEYSDLATAVGAASDGNILQVNEDVTVTSRIENSCAITIQGKTGSEKIMRGPGLDNVVFLTKNAALTLKNLIIDGQGIERAKAAVEASSYAVTMSNVTIQNFAGTSQRVLQVKKSCTVENCTFKDNTVASGYGDIYVGASSLTLKGSNTIGNGIYVEAGYYFNDSETTHESPIKVIADPARTALASNYAFIKGTTDLDKYTLSGNTAWLLAANTTSNYIYVYAPAVTNLTTKTGYSDLASAVTAAVADNVLQINKDVTVTSRIENSCAITIQGREGTEKILRGTGLDNIVFLTKNAALTLKNLIIDGQGTERAKAAVEASSFAVTMSNVTIQNFAGTSQRVLQVKKSCTVENCTFKDNTVAAGYGDIFVGADNCLTLKGSNTIGNGIYVEKALYFNDGGTTHTTPIIVTAASDRGSSDNNGLGSNKAFIKGTIDTYKYTLSGNASWDIAGNESKNYIYVTKAASITKSSDKDMSAGKGYKLGTVTIE